MGGYRARGAVALVLSGASFGTVPFLVRELEAYNVSVVTQVTWRICVTAAVFALVPGVGWRMSRPAYLLTVGNSLCIFASFITYMTAIAWGTSPARAIALVYLYPAWLILLGAVLLNERLVRRRVMAVALALGGALVTTRFWTDGLDRMGGGEALAVTNGLLLAAMVMIGRVAGRVGLPPIKLARWSFLHAAVLAVVVALAHASLSSRGAADVGGTAGVALLVVIGVVGTACAYLLMYHGSAAVASSEAGIWLMSEPLIVVGIGVVLRLSDDVVVELVGVAMILAAGVLVAFTPTDAGHACRSSRVPWPM